MAIEDNIQFNPEKYFFASRAKSCSTCKNADETKGLTTCKINLEVHKLQCSGYIRNPLDDRSRVLYDAWLIKNAK